MSATNSTTHYELPSFLSTDKPAWLVDWNGAMATIDSAIYEAKQAADSAGTSATAVASDLATLSGTVSTQGSTISTLSDTLTTAVGNINTINGNITTINSLIGNGTPTTTDQTIIGAINEINAQIVALSSDNKKPTVITFTATTDSAGAFDYKNGSTSLDTTNCRMVLPVLVNQPFGVLSAFFNSDSEWRGYCKNAQTGSAMTNTSITVVAIAWL